MGWCLLLACQHITTLRGNTPNDSMQLWQVLLSQYFHFEEGQTDAHKTAINFWLNQYIQNFVESVFEIIGYANIHGRQNRATGGWDHQVKNHPLRLQGQLHFPFNFPPFKQSPSIFNMSIYNWGANCIYSLGISFSTGNCKLCRALVLISFK